MAEQQTTWRVRFGRRDADPSEFYALVDDEQGTPVDTFYGGVEEVFEGVGMLLASHASGTGLGRLPNVVDPGGES